MATDIDVQKSESGGFVAYYWTVNDELLEGRSQTVDGALLQLVNEILSGDVEYPEPYEILGGDGLEGDVVDAAREEHGE